MPEHSPSSAQSSQPSSSHRMFMRNVSPEELSALTSLQKGFITTIRSLQDDDTLIGEQLNQTVAEMFPPSVLFSQEICDVPALHSELRKLLDSRGSALSQHSSHRIVMTLATSLYDDSEDTEAATEMAREIVASRRRGRTPAVHSSPAVPSSSSPSRNNLNTEKLAHNVAMRLKQNDQKFSGDLGENWMEFVDEYSQIARDYNLTPQQRQQYLHNLLRADAKRFYLDKVDGYATSYQQAINMINEEYNSPVRQARVKNYLASLRLNSLIEKGMQPNSALAELYKIITKFSRQVPRSHQGDAHKIEFLRNAVVGFQWSHEPLSRVATHSLTFQMLYGELEAALQLHNEARMAMVRDKATESLTKVAGANSVFYQGQGRYVRPQWNKSELNTKMVSPPTSKPRFDPLTVQGCFNCDDPKHMLRQCPKPLNVARAASRKIQYFSKKDATKSAAVYHTLAELATQIDNVADEPTVLIEDTLPLDQSDIFDTILANMPDETSEPNHEDNVITGNQQDSNVYLIDDEILSTQQDAFEGLCVDTAASKTTQQDAFEGLCVDTAASKTVIGIHQAQAYHDMQGLPLILNKTNVVSRFRFGTQRQLGLGSVEIRVPIVGDSFISLKPEVVEINIPLLLGLDVMTQYDMIIDTGALLLRSPQNGWNLPLERKNGHLYFTWNNSVMYTVDELRRVHKHFFHPNASRAYQLLKRADPEKVSPSVLEDLEKISAACDTCQRHGAAPHRFRVSLPIGEITFNRELCLDTMTLERTELLHIVDRDTKFNAAAFLTDSSTESIWDTLCRIWFHVYVGHPDVISCDRGSQFTSPKWKSLVQIVGAQLKLSGVERHNSLSVGERYHHFLREIYTKIKQDNINMSKERALSCAVKAVNDTAGPNGLVPTLLVFGIMPRVPLIPVNLPSQVERMQAMDSARKEAARIVASSRLRRALRSPPPSGLTTFANLAINDEVLVYRENTLKRGAGKWEGPFRVIDLDNKQVTLEMGGRRSNYSIDKIKLYNREAMPMPMSVSTPLIDKTPVNAESTDPEPTQTEPNITAGSPLDDDDVVRKYLNIADTDTATPAFDDLFSHIRIAELLTNDDPRAHSEVFNAAKRQEIDGIIKRNVWIVRKKNDLPDDANVISGRFVLTYKNLGSGNQTAKARYVAQGFRDKEKGRLVHNLVTLRQSSTRLIASIAATKNFRMFSHDVTQAYLQSDEQMTRRVFIVPKKCDLEVLGLDEHSVLELRRPLYGVSDAGDYWGKTIHTHLREELNLTPLVGDPSFYFLEGPKGLEGACAIHVDDEALCGNVKMQRLCEHTTKRFESKPRVWDNFEFFGMYFGSTSDGAITLDQLKYIENLTVLPTDATFKNFRSFRATLAWVGLTRPDMAFAINQFAQVTESQFSLDVIKDINYWIRFVKKHCKDYRLRFKPLREESMYLAVYTDAAFANNTDYTSQLGFIIMLCDCRKTAHILDYSSKKSKRVVRSILAGETYAFADGFDRALMLRRDLERMYKREIPLCMFTDSMQLFHVITKGSITRERRLMIDITAVREAYNSGEISNVGFVLSPYNVADSLTKKDGNRLLRKVLVNGTCDAPVEQWIERTSTNSG